MYITVAKQPVDREEEDKGMVDGVEYPLPEHLVGGVSSRGLAGW